MSRIIGTLRALAFVVCLAVGALAVWAVTPVTPSASAQADPCDIDPDHWQCRGYGVQIPDQPKDVADALAGAARFANGLLPDDPFVVTDVEGPTTVVGYYEGTEQVVRHPDYRDCLRKVEDGVIRVPCPRLIPF